MQVDTGEVWKISTLSITVTHFTVSHHAPHSLVEIFVTFGLRHKIDENYPPPKVSCYMVYGHV